MNRFFNNITSLPLWRTHILWEGVFFRFLHQRQSLVVLFHFYLLTSCFFSASWLKAIILFLDFVILVSWRKKNDGKKYIELDPNENAWIVQVYNVHSTCIIWPIPIETKINLSIERVFNDWAYSAHSICHAINIRITETHYRWLLTSATPSFNRHYWPKLKPAFIWYVHILCWKFTILRLQNDCSGVSCLYFLRR